VQTIGRTARNVNATVLLYGDRITNSMRKAIDETERRRKIQIAYNEKHGITPETVKKAISTELGEQFKARKTAQDALHLSADEYDITEMTAMIEKEMLTAAKELDFEKAAILRDQLQELKDIPELKGD
jgi:excinuclease ABC subunit B